MSGRSRALITGALLASAARSAAADSSASGISWAAWSVSTTEGLWRGRSHEGEPLTYLFDGDPATCWVFSGKSPDPSYGVPHALDLVPAAGELPPVDALRVMNGDNASEESYRRRSRVVRLGVWSGGRQVADVRLPERPGWHVVPLPAYSGPELHLELLEISRGREDVVCLAGLELLREGAPVGWELPVLVIGCDGGEAVSDTSYLMTRDGEQLAADDAGFFGRGAVWSGDGRLVASVTRGATQDEAWIADAREGRIVTRKRLAPLPPEVPYEMAWRGTTLTVRPDPTEAEPGQGEAATLVAP